MQVSTSGFDIAKQTFHVVLFNAKGREVGRKKLSRAKVLAYFAQLPAHKVGLEACAGSHWWARQLQALGHTVKLMSPKTVKAFLQGAKNDYNDARAIALAAMQPGVRAVRHKSVDEQTVQALHRLREHIVGQRTGLINSMRALAHEFGVVMAKGARSFRRELPEVVADAGNDLPDAARRALWEQYALLGTLDERVKDIEQQLETLCEHSEAVALLQEIPGIGALIASALWSALGDGSHWRRGRDLSASLGLVPRQHSSGGHTRLLGISKCGDRYLRYLLINGARSVLCWARTRVRRGLELCPLRRWALQVCQRRGFNKAVVAVANRLARVAWAVLSSGQRYDPQRVGAGAAA